ncbi:MAG: ABC transporter permease [Anaerolineales bacterium]|nr:ABC transporter permease [Anaerolineales bacterium]
MNDPSNPENQIRNNGTPWRRAPRESQWLLTWRALRRNPAAMIGLTGFILLLLVTIAAPRIAPFDPTQIDRSHLLEPPSPVHWFGTDDLGRDILSRVLWGGRESLRVALTAILIGMGGSLIVGLVSGYYGGAVDMIIQRIVDVFLAFPTILLLLSIVAALGPSLSTVLVALGISSIPGASRLVRGSVLAARNYEYVTAAHVVGATNGRIMKRHILPNILAPIIIYSTVGLGGAIMATAGLSYIGLGAQPPSPEWGAMLNYGRTYLRHAWWMSVFPGLGISAAVLSINILGDGLRDALDPRLRI